MPPSASSSDTTSSSSSSNFPSTPCEFVAVVLAATPGARLFPLTTPATPKHLLDVGGVAVLQRLLENLGRAKFQQCVLVISHHDVVTVSSILHNNKENITQVSNNVYRLKTTSMNNKQEHVLQVTIHVLSEGCTGSAEALRELDADADNKSSQQQQQQQHWVVLPGDLIVLDPSVLTELVDSHRNSQLSAASDGTAAATTSTTACTVLLANVGEQDEHGVPLKESAKQKKGGLARDEEDMEYVALSYNSSTATTSTSTAHASPRVIWKQSKIDVEQDEDLVGLTPKLILPKARLRRQVVRVTTDWTDLHAYVLSPWVRKLIQARHTMISLQGDLLPLLVSRQYKGMKATFGSSSYNEDTMDEAQLPETLLPSPSASGHSNSDKPKGDDSADTDEYAVRAHVLDGWKALRVATIPSYLYTCREVVSRVVDKEEAKKYLQLPPNTTVNSKFHSIVLEGANLGEKVTCKSSTVGRRVKLSSRCRLNNVVVMDDVVIGDNCVLQNSILGAGCVIGENCNLNDCQVAPGKNVPAGSKEKGESLMDAL